MSDLRTLDEAAGILAAIMTVAESDRLDALAIAIRAALDTGIVTYRRPALTTQPSTEETR